MSELFSGNKGEWTEPYVLLKLLSDKELFFGDEGSNNVRSIIMPIVSIIRQEQEYQTKYSYDDKKDNIVISLGDDNYYKVPIVQFQKNAISLLQEIKKGKNVFSIPSIDVFLRSIGCQVLKAKSNSKSDIHISVYDPQKGVLPNLGFSIKSELGAKSTLFNASKSTAFIFKIPNFNIVHMDEINNKLTSKNSIDVKGRVKRLFELGYELKLDCLENNNFENNLVMVDSKFPEIMSKMLLMYYSGEATDIYHIVTKLYDINPMRYNKINHHDFYAYKVKHFLTISALGMTATKTWQGKYDATGGYLVVKKDGEIVGYHIYNKNEFEDYLFYNTKFDTPDPKPEKWDFGRMYEQNGEFFFKLNFQIRFK